MTKIFPYKAKLIQYVNYTYKAKIQNIHMNFISILLKRASITTVVRQKDSRDKIIDSFVI